VKTRQAIKDSDGEPEGLENVEGLFLNTFTLAESGETNFVVSNGSTQDLGTSHGKYQDCECHQRREILQVWEHINQRNLPTGKEAVFFWVEMWR
jgi:hypothetical protein